MGGTRDQIINESARVLQRSGFDMKNWGKLGAFWGGLWALLFGSAFFFIPGIGPAHRVRPTGRLDCRRAGRCGGGWWSQSTDPGALISPPVPSISTLGLHEGG